MTVIEMTAAQFISAWENEEITEIALVREIASHWYIFVKSTPTPGGGETQAVIKVMRP